ncbi:hypothetical protein AGABI1DRAFT_82837, partial [Agaricus bisporus var. burnettii JB137-S8]
MIGLHGLLVKGFLRHLKRQKERKRGEAKNGWERMGETRKVGVEDETWSRRYERVPF